MFARRSMTTIVMTTITVSMLASMGLAQAGGGKDSKDGKGRGCLTPPAYDETIIPTDIWQTAAPVIFIPLHFIERLLVLYACARALK